MNSWIIVVVTLFFSALCSGLEIAFNSINRLQLEVELTKNTFFQEPVAIHHIAIVGQQHRAHRLWHEHVAVA